MLEERLYHDDYINQIEKLDRSTLKSALGIDHEYPREIFQAVKIAK